MLITDPITKTNKSRLSLTPSTEQVATTNSYLDPYNTMRNSMRDALQPKLYGKSNPMFTSTPMQFQKSASDLAGYQEMLVGPKRREKTTTDPYASAYSGGSGSWTGKSGTGLGLANYGWNGNTGVEGTRGSAPMGLQQVFYQKLTAAFNQLEQEGLGRPGITDGWRSYEGQVAAKNKWTKLGKPNMAATPGRSVHGIGLAADLKLSGAQYNRLMQIAGQYGLRNLKGERWHWQLDPQVWASYRKS